MKNEVEKVVIFDWGGVIEEVKDDKHNINHAIKEILKKYNCSLSDAQILNKYLSVSEIKNTFVHDDEQTEIDWFEHEKAKLKLNCTFEEFQNAYYKYGKKVPYHKDVVKFAHSLKKYCKIAIFSSLVELDRKRIDDQVNLSMFDYTFLSYEIGYDKTDSKSYEFVEKKLNVSPQNILYIDDTAANIEQAKKRNWNTCLANGYELNMIKDCVKKFLEI